MTDETVGKPVKMTRRSGVKRKHYVFSEEGEAKVEALRKRLSADAGFDLSWRQAAEVVFRRGLAATDQAT